MLPRIYVDGNSLASDRFSSYPADMTVTVLWQIKSDGSPLMRCELEGLEDGRYRVRIVRRKRPSPELFLEQEFPDHESALRLSVVVYRKLKDNGFHDTPRPA